MGRITLCSKNFSSFCVCLLLVLGSCFFPISVFALEKTFTNSLGMEFILIPSGTFIMGSPVDEPNRGSSEVQHRVSISRLFFMQTTEVTIKQWRALMGSRLLASQKDSDNIPVTQVSWFDCMEFIKRLNRLGEGKYRLPTEAEWEYAARAGTQSAFFWGETLGCEKAMFGNNSLKYNVCQRYIQSIGLAIDQPAPVKSYQPNLWGLYDMHGNVWEWCMDRYGDLGKNPVTDPNGPKSGAMRIRRGGSWFKHDHACRSANRSFGHPATRYSTTGFRLVRDVP